MGQVPFHACQPGALKGSLTTQWSASRSVGDGHSSERRRRVWRAADWLEGCCASSRLPSARQGVRRLPVYFSSRSAVIGEDVFSEPARGWTGTIRPTARLTINGINGSLGQAAIDREVVAVSSYRLGSEHNCPCTATIATAARSASSAHGNRLTATRTVSLTDRLAPSPTGPRWPNPFCRRRSVNPRVRATARSDCQCCGGRVARRPPRFDRLVLRRWLLASCICTTPVRSTCATVGVLKDQLRRAGVLDEWEVRATPSRNALLVSTHRRGPTTRARVPRQR